MQKKKSRRVPTPVDYELQWLIDSVSEVPYSALPQDLPQIFFIAGSIKVLIGYTAAEIYADKQLWMNIIHPDDRQQVLAAFTSCKNQATAFEVEYRLIHKDGSLRYVIDRGEPIFNDKGQITQIDGIITDITDQKQAGNMQLSKIPEAAEQ